MCCDELSEEQSTSTCRFDVTESIPIGVTFKNGPVYNSTYNEIKSLIQNAQRTIDIASFYWTLKGTDVMPNPDSSSQEGEDFLNSLVNAAKRGVRVRIAVNGDDRLSSQEDIRELKEAGAEIRAVNFTRLLRAGVLHTKFIVTDDANFYVGSANMDWRSLTQVKELGVTIRNCPVLSLDLLKIFQVYWLLGLPDSQIPTEWPANLTTEYNVDTPVSVKLGPTQSEVFLSSSPLPFNPKGRTNDVSAVVAVINRAEKFINIAVMDYFPSFLYTKREKYWPVIDDALRRAAVERGVHVRLMASKWKSTRKSLYSYLKSLSSLKQLKSRGYIETKLFIVPSDAQQAKIPFARVNHNKYMVTDQDVLIGTSNWSADYFTNTGGVSLVVHENNSSCYRNHSLRESLVGVFDRDWSSDYAHLVYSD